MRALIVLAVMVAGACGMRGQDVAPVTVTSPNGELVLTLSVQAKKGAETQGGKLGYAVAFRGKAVMAQSALSLQLASGNALGSAVVIAGAESGQGVDAYTLRFQKTSAVHDAYNSVIVHAEEPSGDRRKLDVEARAYDGGVAFRYRVPAQSGMTELALKQEGTEFRQVTDATDWLLALPNYRSSYESEYVQLPTTALGNQGGVPSSFLIGLPLLMHEPGLAWMALTEADVEGSSTLYVTNPSGNWAGKWLGARISPSVDHPEAAVEQALPWESAWRVLLVADDPGRLLESTIQYSLNPPSRVEDTSWIHAGKASWNWWVDSVDAKGEHAFTTENMKRYVDFAAESGLRYFLLDAGWAGKTLTELNGKVDVPELVRYAKTKNVGVWIWCGAGAVAQQMKTAFPVFEQWGVAGVKIDFVNRDDQTGVQWYYDTARVAAEHHLMVDFHGTRTPWGIERTYPNVMSYEGVLGAENNKVGRRDSPVDRTVLAFTRALAGPMDYTPGAFNNATEDGFVAQNAPPMSMGTRAQQLALYVVFQTPFPMASDSPQMYEGVPEFKFIRDVPAEWDETRVLNGKVGEYITVARRSGAEWDLGSITNWTARTLNVQLGFLGKGKFRAEIYADAADADVQPKHVVMSTKVVTGADSLTLVLASGGGCAVRFVPVK